MVPFYFLLFFFRGFEVNACRFSCFAFSLSHYIYKKRTLLIRDLGPFSLYFLLFSTLQASFFLYIYFSLLVLQK